jgi:hypothetical protein
MENLNKIEPENDGNFQHNYERSSKYIAQDIGLEVYFDNLEQHLIKHIEKADAVFGCVAWLTNFRILAALQKKRIVSIVVQKEDFLRPDFDVTNRQGWKIQLRKMYESLKCDIDRFEMPGLLGYVSQNGDPSIDPIRCVGNYNYEKSPAFPRMHHKFLVFCRGVTPYAVWTGSFNLTHNSNHSLENAVYIERNDIAQGYYDEYAHIFTLSERLDWQNVWVTPDYRIGT